MNLQEIKLIFEQCQWCKHWDIENGCTHPKASTEQPISNCRCYEEQEQSQYIKVLPSKHKR